MKKRVLCSEKMRLLKGQSVQSTTPPAHSVSRYIAPCAILIGPLYARTPACKDIVSSYGRLVF